MGKEDCARGQTYLIFCFHNISAGINLSLKKKKEKRGSREADFIIRANTLFCLGSYSGKDSHQRCSCS